MSILLFVLTLVATLACVGFSLLRMRHAGVISGLVAIFALFVGVLSGFSYNNPKQNAIRSITMFAPEMPVGRVVSPGGTKGPQARLLGPGFQWSNPLTISVLKVDLAVIQPGQVGVVVALDGKPLPQGITYAPEWPSLDLLDAEKFLSSPDHGFKGPQLTVLPPAEYPYNPALFTIVARPALTVHTGEVVVIKNNAGRAFTGEAETINGVPLVPPGFAGICAVPLLPGTHYIHPDAYTAIRVKSTQRVYVYQKNDKDDDSIIVRSKDNFPTAIEVRASVVVEPKDAPKVVALFGNPDLIENNQQEGEPLEILESQAVLPVLGRRGKWCAGLRNGRAVASMRERPAPPGMSARHARPARPACQGVASRPRPPARHGRRRAARRPLRPAGGCRSGY